MSFSKKVNSYFEKTPVFDFAGLIETDKPYYAHIKDEKRPENLKEHLDLTLDYFGLLCREKHLESVFRCLEKNFFPDCARETVYLWLEMILNTIYLNYFGNIITNFQRGKMEY